MTSHNVLHQLLSDDPRALSDCLAVFRQGDELLLIDQGVQWLCCPRLVEEKLADLGFSAQIGVLAADVALRALDSFVDQSSVTRVSDAQWVEKVCIFDQVLSWK